MRPLLTAAILLALAATSLAQQSCPTNVPPNTDTFIITTGGLHPPYASWQPGPDPAWLKPAHPTPQYEVDSVQAFYTRFKVKHCDQSMVDYKWSIKAVLRMKLNGQEHVRQDVAFQELHDGSRSAKIKTLYLSEAYTLDELGSGNVVFELWAKQISPNPQANYTRIINHSNPFHVVNVSE